MANTILSLIGPDLDPNNVTVDGVPGVATVTPNTSSANTQTTLRRCYAVVVDAAALVVKIATGLPSQDLPGSFALTLTPIAGASGKSAYERFASAGYLSDTGELSLELESPLGATDAGVIVSVDLAHTATR